MSIRELKEIIKDWPEVSDDGDPSEVWITTGINLSSQCVRFELLNRSDILLVPRNYE